MSKLLKAQQTSLTLQAYRMPEQQVYFPRPDSAEETELEAAKSAAEQAAEAILNEARATARDLLAQAEAEATGLLEQERQNVQTLLQADVEAAKALGYQEGMAQGVRQAEADCAGMLMAAEEQYRSAAEERRRYLAEAEPMIVDLALSIAKKIITRESSVDRSFVVDVVSTALEEMHDGGKVEVRVHPDDHDVVQQSREQLRKAVPGQTELLIIKDHSVEAGGCVVCTAFGNIDARIDTQLEEVRKALQEVAASLEP
ncbi:FliH/SctL family protein [Tumebacillus avium]|uniref:FliH/SctL family protein n=1 Tax=Tumebacillus avium TaxID=1903704 RepID=UPI0012FD412D|nr:FliH/SctL family protein [Tumebacillus avium]